MGIAWEHEKCPVAIENRQHDIKNVAHHLFKVIRPLDGPVDPVHIFKEPQICQTLVLCLLYPCLAGGCPEFRNGAVDAIDAATRELLFGDATQQDAVVNAGQGVANAALDLLFDFLRAPSTR